MMRAPVRRFALALHVVVSVGSVGAVASFMALAVAGIASPDAMLVRSAFVAMAYLAPFVVVPLVLSSLATGLWSSLGTNWGLIRHYWIATKLALTVVASVVLLLQIELIERLGQAVAAGMPLPTGQHGGPAALLVHSAGGLLVLIANAVISVYKPWGPTSNNAQRKLG